ncbi:hypothetical protein P261_01988 [Lachnospiraceae bacterium TWA4]|nr:hypothetical protein P261_01988 [Lachnospiraceae bacterium TWA4]
MYSHDYEHQNVIKVYPGIYASYNYYTQNQKIFHHGANPLTMEVNHCHYGRTGWNFSNGTSIYMGEGDVTLHSAALCADSIMKFPLGSYQGITFVYDFDYLFQNTPDIIQSADISLHKIVEMFCKTDSSFTYNPCEQIEQIFSPLYHLPEGLQLPYLKLKSQELLLFLSNQTQNLPTSPVYHSDITDTIREVHSLLTEHLETRYTIEELSSKFLINTSTLKDAFKAVYGAPIATYMKEYRLRHAARLLRHTEDGILDIAASVGYKTQSKFTKAFKEVMGILPSEYRKQR